MFKYLLGTHCVSLQKGVILQVHIPYAKSTQNAKVHEAMPLQSLKTKSTKKSSHVSRGSTQLTVITCFPLCQITFQPRDTKSIYIHVCPHLLYIYPYTSIFLLVLSREHLNTHSPVSKRKNPTRHVLSLPPPSCALPSIERINDAAIDSAQRPGIPVFNPPCSCIHICIYIPSSCNSQHTPISQTHQYTQRLSVQPSKHIYPPNANNTTHHSMRGCSSKTSSAAWTKNCCSSDPASECLYR